MKCLSINIFIFNFPPVPPPVLSCRSHLQQSHLQPYAAHTSFTNLQHACGGTIKENVNVIARAMINFINRYAEGELSI